MRYERSLQKLGREVAEELDAMRDGTVVAETRRRLFDPSAAKAPPRPSRRPVMVAVGGLALAAAVALLFVVRTRGPGPMAFSIDDRPGEVGAWIAAPAAQPAGLRFADGTRFDLEPSGRARVTNATTAAGHLVLERGRLTGDVTAHDHAAVWRVTAGPFDVSVSGRFTLEWDPDREELAVRDVSERVVVKGPYAAEGVTVRRGEQVRVSLPSAKLEVSAAVPPARPPAPASSPEP